MKNRICVLVVMMLAILTAVSYAQDDTVPQALSAETTIPCPFAMPSSEVEGVTISCGQIEVQQNWDNPDGTTINIMYAIMHSDNPAAFTDPVVYFSGGPGESVITALPLQIESFAAIRMNRDVIIWDPRGTTHSSIIECPAEIQIPDPAAYNESQSSFSQLTAMFDTNSDPDVLYDALSEHFALSDYGNCLPYWEEQGIDVSQYNTRNSNLDAIALMSHLGYPEYNLYGGSYGTTRVLGLADFYTNNPDLDLPPIRSALIDGVFPRNFEWYEQSYLRARGALKTFDLCEADAACAAAYPNIRQRATDLLFAIEESLIVREDGSEITIDDLARLLLQSPAPNPGLIPYLPRLIAELEQGITDTYDFAQNLSISSIYETPDTDSTDVDEIVEQLEDIQSQVRDIGDDRSIIAEAARQADSPVTYAVAILEVYSARVVNGGIDIFTFLEAARIDPEQRTREQLQFMASFLRFESVRNELSTIIDQLSDEEVTEVFDLVFARGFTSKYITDNTVIRFIVQCNDRGDNYSNDVAYDAYSSFEAPQLIRERVYVIVEFEIRCEQLGLLPDTYTPAPPGVVSDWPFLVINGARDLQTSVAWGELAFETLTNADMVTIPDGGHVSSLAPLAPNPLSGSACARGIANAFFLSPDEELNLSCLEDAMPEFVLPEDELPSSSDG